MGGGGNQEYRVDTSATFPTCGSPGDPTVGGKYSNHSTAAPTSRGAVGWCATELGCGRLWGRIPARVARQWGSSQEDTTWGRGRVWTRWDESAEKQFSVGARRLVVRSRRDRSTSSLVYAFTQPQPLGDVRWEDEVQQADVLFALLVHSLARLLDAALQLVHAPAHCINKSHSKTSAADLGCGRLWVRIPGKARITSGPQVDEWLKFQSEMTSHERSDNSHLNAKSKKILAITRLAFISFDKLCHTKTRQSENVAGPVRWYRLFTWSLHREQPLAALRYRAPRERSERWVEFRSRALTATGRLADCDTVRSRHPQPSPTCQSVSSLQTPGNCTGRRCFGCERRSHPEILTRVTGIFSPNMITLRAHEYVATSLWSDFLDSVRRRNILEAELQQGCSGQINVRLHHRGSKLDPRSDLRLTQKTVAPFEFRPVLEIEIKFISKRRNWRFEISIRVQQLSSTNIVESEIQNHEISLVQQFYIGAKIKLDPGSELESFDLEWGKMMMHTSPLKAIRRVPTPSPHLRCFARDHSTLLKAVHDKVFTLEMNLRKKSLLLHWCSGLDYSPPTWANRVRFPAGSPPNFRTWGSYRTIPLVGGFSRGSPVSAALAFRRYCMLTSSSPSRPRCLEPPKSLHSLTHPTYREQRSVTKRVLQAAASDLATVASETQLHRFDWLPPRQLKLGVSFQITDNVVHKEKTAHQDWEQPSTVVHAIARKVGSSNKTAWNVLNEKQLQPHYSRRVQ
ncbi:hypothetical protein PR048_000479 [Dryococelus australis]|uniref:Uncharacterized protein n=1 Tax=Dryococelus australis TaxID=614101 RepID=A0ABQ9IER6_9NEOP|nr:hypothetical protein PR048_000479 [Dryococelus australis]